MKSFAVGIPTLNRYDILSDFLDRYNDDFKETEVHVLDNGNQGIVPRHNNIIHVMKENIGVAASWNILCKEIFKKHSHAFILNDDVYSGFVYNSLMNYVQEFEFCQAEKGYCCFLISAATFKKVGPFDEVFFPAYFEDNDYSYRLSLSDVKVYTSTAFDPQIFNRSKTVEKDRSINDFFMKNHDYYLKKWGGKPGQEKFKKPFNE